MRKSINASNSKRNAEFSSPGRPEYGGTHVQPSSAQFARKSNNNLNATGAGVGITLQQTQATENMTTNYVEILSENERLRNEKLELENSNHILRKFKKIYNQTAQV